MTKTNELRVRNLAQKIMWDDELAGQISDGMWENAQPHDHWQVWTDAEVVVDPQHVGRDFYARKANYQLNSKDLLDIVGGRMLAKVQETIPDYTRKTMLADLADLRKIIKNEATPSRPDNDAEVAAERSVIDGVRTDPFAGQPVAADPYEGQRNGKGQPVDEAPATAPTKLMRKPSKTVAEYVDWLREQLGGEAWAELSLDPTRLAQVSLQNYGAFQATRRAAK